MIGYASYAGYGYAKAGKAEIGRWTSLIRDYLRGRPTLHRVILLIDARHGLKSHDKEVMDALDTSAVIYQLVLTKADKIKPSELAQTLAATQSAIAKRPAAHPVIIATSSETGPASSFCALKSRPWRNRANRLGTAS